MKIYDYPRNIIKALSDRISKRISNISPHKVMFDNATPFYNYGLPTRGYEKSSTYQKNPAAFKQSRTKKDNVV